MVLSRGQLSRKVQQNLGTIRGGVARGLSSSAINALVRSDQGVGLRRTDLLAGIRHIRNIEEAGARLRSIRRDLSPDPRRLPHAKTPILSDYSYTVQVRGTDPSSNQQVRANLTVRKNRPMSRADIEQETQDAIDEGVKKGAFYSKIKVDIILIVDGRQRGG